jgi:hypothetical protein
MEAAELQAKLRAAFSTRQRPAKEAIASCACWECSEIRDDFGSSEPEDLPDKLMGYHCHDLGFMTPKARLYFLRGWMTLAILQPDRAYGEAVCDILCRDDGWIEASEPSPHQLEVIGDFLEFLRESSGGRSVREGTRALEILTELTLSLGNR